MNSVGHIVGPVLSNSLHRSWWIRVMPFLSEVCYRRRCLRILHARNEATVQMEWKSVGVPYPFVRRVSDVVSKNCGWPNSLFMPADECSVILFPDGDFNLESIDTLEALARELWVSRDNTLAVSPLIASQRIVT